MKYGKEFISQMVPEWQEAYMNYGYLKTLLKDIQRFKGSDGSPGSGRQSSVYRTFTGLLRRNDSQNQPMNPNSADVEGEIISVNSMAQGGFRNYETRFATPVDERGEYERVFFRRLDYEFNKVNNFYKSKVEEELKEAAMLTKQMDALLAFRIKVKDPNLRAYMLLDTARITSDVEASSTALTATAPAGARAAGRRALDDFLREVELETQKRPDGSSCGCECDKEDDAINQYVPEQKLDNVRATRHAPLQVLETLKINNTLETPLSTIKGLLNAPKHTQPNFNRESLKKVEQRLKQAFVIFYHKLRLLKSYSFLNTLAFSKILKKYDKIAKRNASKAYLKMVDDSYLGTSDEVIKLMERVEATFINNFSNANRSKGMDILRPKTKKERHRVTFSMGFFAGCTAALLMALSLITRARNLLHKPGASLYMESMFPLYSLFGFVVLHMFMYAANIYFWRRYRINYSFIFGFKQGTELGYREVLLLSFCLATLALASVVSNLDMEMDPKTNDYKAITELLPLGVVVIVFIIFFCPFNIMFRSSRFFFLTCLFHCLCAPLYKVTFPDFFLADELTSQLQAFRSLEFYVCYYGWGDYKLRQNTCNTSNVFRVLSFIIIGIPFWCRLFQCLRRLFEEKDPTHGYNGLKYFSALVAISARTAYSLDKRKINWKTMAWLFSVVSAIYGTYWDLVVDWGLLQRQSRNRWLRDKLLIPYKSVYFGAMVFNVLLRFAWLETLLNFQVSFPHKEVLITIVASLEIIRRGIWNFFRLENEHLNNVGAYRAFKSVPLPFNYDEDEEKDD